MFCTAFTTSAIVILEKSLFYFKEEFFTQTLARQAKIFFITHWSHSFLSTGSLLVKEKERQKSKLPFQTLSDATYFH